MRRIISKCWQYVCGPHVQLAMVHMAAFQLLAGIISHVRRIKGAHVMDLLRDLEACDYPGYLLIQRAEKWVDDLPPVTARSGGHRPPTIKALARQVEARVDNGQLSSAISIVERKSAG